MASSTEDDTTTISKTEQQPTSKAVAAASSAAAASSTTESNTTSTSTNSSNFEKMKSDAVVADPKIHVDFILSHHQSLPKLQHKEASGGVLPFTQDPITKEIFIALGLSKKDLYNSFYGFIDGGETPEQGSAREAWEESKAVLGDLPTLWRAVMLKGYFSFIVGHPYKLMHAINIGEMNALARAQFVAKFNTAKGWSHCSMEVKGLKFFELKTLKHLCASSVAKFERDQAKLKESERLPNAQPMVLVSVDEQTGKYEHLRIGMVKQLIDPRFWQQQELVQMMEMGVPLRDIVLPLSMLPVIDKSVAAILPFQKAATRRPTHH